jgi:alpha-beta hydrolase superfamily lysophospholipase
MMEQSTETLTSGDTALALHCWRPDEPKAVLFYVHGIQSHAGWLFETGPAMAERGVALYALDRRGSGRSSGARGQVGHFQEWLTDYGHAGGRVRHRHPDIPLALLGQSMGGSIAAALATQGQTPYDALVLCAPALGQVSRRLTAGMRETLERSDPELLQAVPLEDEWYTRELRYLRFMGSDPLMLRQVRSRFRTSMLEMEQYYLGGSTWKTGPKALVLPRTDRIIDLASVREHFAALSGGESLIVELPADEHYLEFSRWRAPLWNFLAAFAQRGCVGWPS